ncbi:MAG: hypothetical protein M3Z04_19330, partial [Chloroflexota bacterium]|nr:hypothetical protein [Chloroflexota bacterium]
AGQAGLEEMLRQIGGEAFVALLHRAGGALGRIVADPGAFLGNLLRGLQAGFQQFAAHLGSHLQTGLQDWLFGQLGGAGLQLPDKLDAGGVFSIVLQLLGLGIGQLRALLVKRLGPQAGALLDEAGTLLTALVQGGLQGLWSEVQDQLGDLKDLVLNGVRDWAITKVVGAAVTKIIAMFTPAGAIFELLQTIWNVFQFVTERLSQLRALGEAVLGALEAIAGGQVDGVAGKIESVLTSGLSVVLSLLANLVGLGGVSSKIHDTLTKIRTRIDTAIDALLDKLIGKAKGRVGTPPTPATAAPAGLADDEAAAHHHGHPNGDDSAADHAGHTATPAPTTAAPAHPTATAPTNPAPARPTPATAAPGHPDLHAPATSGSATTPTAPATDAKATSAIAPPLKQTFTMNGVTHTLTVTFGPQAKVKMASRPDWLSEKVGRAVGWITGLYRQADKELQKPDIMRDQHNNRRLKDIVASLNQHKETLKLIGGKTKEAERAAWQGRVEQVKITAQELEEIVKTYGLTQRATDIEPGASFTAAEINAVLITVAQQHNMKPDELDRAVTQHGIDTVVNQTQGDPQQPLDPHTATGLDAHLTEIAQSYDTRHRLRLANSIDPLPKAGDPNVPYREEIKAIKAEDVYGGDSGHAPEMQAAIKQGLKGHENWIAIVRNRAKGAAIWDRLKKESKIVASGNIFNITDKDRDNGWRWTVIKGTNGETMAAVSDLDFAAMVTAGTSMDDIDFNDSVRADISNAYRDNMAPSVANGPDLSQHGRSPIRGVRATDLVQHGTHVEGLVGRKKGADLRYLLDTVWVYNHTGLINQGPMWQMFKKYIKSLI